VFEFLGGEWGVEKQPLFSLIGWVIRWLTFGTIFIFYAEKCWQGSSQGGY
jgi:hypothetical protein